METLVLNLCGFWLWLTRKSRATRYAQIGRSLHSARAYLLSDYNTRASTLDRGGLLPEQKEALVILERQAAAVAETSSRFASIRECRRLMSEEFAPQQKAA